MKPIAELVLEAAEEPRALPTIYEMVLAMRPGTAKETVRARVYEQVDNGKILRIARGVYVAVDGAAKLLMVTGDAWEAIKEIPDGAIDLLISDVPFDLGTAKNALQHGTTRLKGRGREYAQRDLDEAFLREAYRIITKERTWRKLRGGEAAGPGFCVLLTPMRNRDTAPHIDALLRLAESVGFEFAFEQAVDFEDRGMGYWPPQRHWLWQYLSAGPRVGIPDDLTVSSVVRAKRVRRKSAPGVEEHEAEKPVEAFMAPIRMVTRPGHIVYDPFGGRAAWAREAVRSGRHVILIDSDERWMDKIANKDW